MSYIIERQAPIFLTKLTDTGRKAIAQGNFSLDFYGVGDSEIPYNELGDVKLKLLKTKDRQPNIKSFLQTGFECESLQPITAQQVNTVRTKVFNEARMRGFFDSAYVDVADIDTSLIKFSGTTDLSKFDGTKLWDIDGDMSPTDFLSLEDGDIVLFKFYNQLTQGLENNVQTSIPVPYLFFSVNKRGGLPELDVDRFLPFFSFLPNAETIDVPYFVFPSKQKSLDYYSPSGRTISWNTETLEFYENCEDTDVDVWNMNIVNCRSLIGTTGCTEDYKKYGSYDYISTMQYLDYCDECIDNDNQGTDCDDALTNKYFVSKDMIGIIHFSNYNTRNEYGEYLAIDANKRFRLHLPHVMWHGRSFDDLSGQTLGMSFVSASGDTEYIQSQRQNIEYYDLIEDERYISGRAPIVIGKVFPELKIAVIEHPDLLAALSYKSNRNWTLPRLKGKMIFPKSGVGNGVLPRGKRMYATYMFKNDNGIQNTLPQMQPMIFDNNTQVDRDVEFQLEDIGYLGYMRQIEDSAYDGKGFYANKFIVLYQITDIGQSPNEAEWQMLDFTNNRIRPLSGTTISPSLLEEQDAAANNFYITNYTAQANDIGIYGNDFHCIACDSSFLTMGNERVFFGNIETFIGANIYKWVVNITLDEKIVETENDSYVDGDFYFSEIGFYNKDKELMMISKLSKPIRLRAGTRTEVEVTMDF